ncbi:hypothetical protein [Alteromonas macleodii]|uniref:Uncharacterized protein n=1 Tax=Alteromonas macleodii (strain English Channel 673) TaxID=1004788 RepID=A0AB32ZYC4_ALTME|nr:hypothetical protein [Alteromonas macleodii]AFT74514.1 hypothetical protein AMEC673_09100 [Alteromonas macleodii str. 'English Channel 673']MBL3809342.1 hypothetical protein [Alteromonas macleodii]MBL3882879.1 hypothetical protein [Alteromonas macleodii]
MTEWKKVFLYAIAPALIAGVFAVSPKLYDELTEPKAVLEYSVNRGPIIRSDEAYKSIYAIDVINNGKRPLSNVHASIKSKGNIEAINTYESTGLSPKISSPGITVETLHPGESFTISLMLVTRDEDNSIDFILRSKESLGSEIKPVDAKKDKKLDIASALAAGSSVFAMALYFMLRLRGSGSIGAILTSEKSNILFYIAAKFGFDKILDHYGVEDGSVTYLRFGDILYSIGENGSPEVKRKAIIALKSMLLNSTMAGISKQCIIRNIKALEGDEFSDEELTLLNEKSCDASELIKIRGLIDEYSASPSAFLSQTD